MLFQRGLLPACVCIECISGATEDYNHLLLKCTAANNIWRWLSQVLGVNLLAFSEAKELVKWAAMQDRKNTVGQLRTTCVLHGLWNVWKVRNKLVFDRETTSLQAAVSMVRKSVCAVGFLHKGWIYNGNRHVLLCDFFNVKVSFKKQIMVKEVIWQRPQPGWTKVNFDGATGDKQEKLRVGAYSVCTGDSQGDALDFRWESMRLFL